MKKTIKERLLDRTEYDAKSNCWLWTGATQGGYGKMYANGKVRSVHRIAYEVLIGPIPKGLQVCHRCDVKVCINPEHLFTGTQSDNLLDARGKDRFPSQKLTNVDVLKIRSEYAPGVVTMEVLGRKYGVTKNAISRVIRRESWG